MSAKTPRMEALKEVLSRTPRKIELPEKKVSEYFGENIFGLARMKERLPKDCLQKLSATLETGSHLDHDVANVVAQAVKDWALEKGASHFCHWFQPQTGLTAEKHDAFLSFDENHQPIEQFSADQLIQSEPDASSFPSGGMRSTFEARGYTAWDPSSPMFILESTNSKTLCIPSAFISYTGDTLDYKTGLLRSNEALSDKTIELLKTMGETGMRRVVATVGTEQEYFLVDRSFYALRPDLIFAGRTLLGAAAPKGQQLEDHYFGSIPSRVQAFMAECEYELYRLGVPVKTRHNEVAPSQFECAPIFEEANIAVDHNQLTMEVLRKVGRRHGYEVLLHEKPFSFLNGSGKHTNWSLSIAGGAEELKGINLLNPGKTPSQNLRFLMVLAGILKGVNKHAGLLRAAIASAGNDHRLGANEAPPAIISVFLGDELTRVLDNLEKAGKSVESSNAETIMLQLGVNRLPQIRKDNTDRNRTSPFAFTGNKFEFRAVGSSQPVARAVTLLNAVVADGFSELTEILKTKLKSAPTKEAAVLEAVQQAVLETKRIRFEGNNYSAEWVKEAEKRGLPNLQKTPEALREMVNPKATEMLTRLKVFSEGELQSRFRISMERYVKDLLIEGNTLVSMVRTQVIPAAITFHHQLLDTGLKAKQLGVYFPEATLCDELSKGIADLESQERRLSEALVKVEHYLEEVEKGAELAKELIFLMDEIRSTSNGIERMMPARLWPFPNATEMLFLN